VLYIIVVFPWNHLSCAIFYFLFCSVSHNSIGENASI